MMATISNRGQNIAAEQNRSWFKTFCSMNENIDLFVHFQKQIIFCESRSTKALQAGHMGQDDRLAGRESCDHFGGNCAQDDYICHYQHLKGKLAGHETCIEYQILIL